VVRGGLGMGWHTFIGLGSGSGFLSVENPFSIFLIS
jgi:hypothetical protein